MPMQKFRGRAKTSRWESPPTAGCVGIRIPIYSFSNIEPIRGENRRSYVFIK